jgi:hypothetical protein
MMVACFGIQPLAQQPPRASPANKSDNRACSLLTREVVTKVTPYEKQALDLVMRVPPNSDALGARGSECTYGGAAYFRDNGGRWAELYVRTGAHVITIQMSVPTGRTAASIQPNVVALAKVLLPQLK